MQDYPVVAIVGRTNVGKSTLFNRLTRGKHSIVFPREGVTRDYIHEIVTWNEIPFRLIDTGGLPASKKEISSAKDAILKEVRDSVLSTIEKAHVLIFVCDGKNGLVEQDRQLARLFHKSQKPVLLVLNKSDNLQAFKDHELEFIALGFKSVFPVSATHGTGISELLDAITESLGTTVTSLSTQAPKEISTRIAILGKPNVGKSSLLNLLLKEQRAIVSDVAGTTREAISESIPFHKEMIQLTDTPGVRRQSKIDDPLEEAMVKSALQAVRESDIVLMMIDATEGHISDQELKLMFYAYEEKKSIIFICNKTDILTENDKDRLKYDFAKYEFFVKKIPLIWISCVSQKNIGNVFKAIQKAQQRRRQQFNQEEVNELIKEAFIKKPLYHKTTLLKVMHIKVIESSHPAFVLYVNFPQWFGPTQLGFIENQLRKQYDLLGCPISFIVQKV